MAKTGLFAAFLIVLSACRPQHGASPEADFVPPPACPAVDALRKQSFAAYDDGDFEKAEQLQREAAVLALKEGCDSVHWVKARCNMADALRKKDPEHGLERAIDSLLADLPKVSLARPDLRGMLQFWIGTFYLRQSDFLHTRMYFDAARAAHELHHVPVTSRAAAGLYKPLANIYTRLGENEKGIFLLRIALDTLRKSAYPADIPAAYNDLGLAYANWDKPDSACAQYARGWRFFQEHPDDESIEDQVTRSDVLSNWARALLSAGRPDSAMLLAQEALRLDPEHPGTLLILSHLAAQSGDLQRAEGLVNQACGVLQEDSPPLNRELAKALLWQAELKRRRQDFSTALRDCQEAFRWVLPGFGGGNPAPASFYPENTILEALDLKSRVLWQQYEQQHEATALQAADTTTVLALQMADTLGTAYGFESSQLASLADIRNLHERYLQILFEQHRRSDNPALLARMVAFSEKSRAILLRQKLSGQRALVAGSASDSLAQHERLLREALVEAKNELAYLEADGATSGELDAQRQKIFALDDQRNQLLQRLRATAPLYFNRQFGHASATLADIQAALPDDSTLLVEYFYNPESGALYQLGITRSAVRLHRNNLPNSDLQDFQVLVRNAALGMASEGDPEFVRLYANLAGALYDTLLRPLCGPRPPSALIVVPDGLLGAVPFDALLTAAPNPTQNSFRQLPYLLRSTRVRLAPSATVLLAAGERLAAGSGRGYLGIAAAYPAGGFFEPVEYGEACVQWLAKSFGSDPLSGATATKTRFRSEAPHCRILHFYGHGKANNENPERSFVAFTPTRAPQAPAAATADAPVSDSLRSLSVRSGLPPEVIPDVMFAQEISLMELPADLVVLSACETGVGPAAGGEGIFSLARAFQEAGCPSVAMTLWEVNDAATAGMSTGFLEGIHQGLDKDEALRQAKLYQLNNGRSAIPYFWSGFVLTGNADPLHMDEGGEGWFFEKISLALSALLLLLAGLWWWRTRRARV